MQIAFVASDTPDAQASLDRLSQRYGDCPTRDAEVIVALGGDGLMLQTLHATMGDARPIYGMHRGTIGFLMNAYHEDDLPARLAVAERDVIHPLRMRATTAGGVYESLAINEVSLFRQTHQAAWLAIAIDGAMRLPTLIGDGVIVATPAGSTAYNLSLQGPILPISAPLLALTPISPFRPRRWRGAVLPNGAAIDIAVLAPDKRPVSAVADHHEIRDVHRVEVAEERAVTLTLLFDKGHALADRILAEQFRV